MNRLYVKVVSYGMQHFHPNTVYCQLGAFMYLSIFILTKILVSVAKIPKISYVCSWVISSYFFSQICQYFLFFSGHIYCLTVECKFFIKWSWSVCLCVPWKINCTKGGNLVILLENGFERKKISCYDLERKVFGWFGQCPT